MSIPNRIIYSVAKRKKVNSTDETRTQFTFSPRRCASQRYSTLAESDQLFSLERTQWPSQKSRLPQSSHSLQPSPRLRPGASSQDQVDALVALSLDKAPSFLRFTPSSGASGPGYDDQPNLTILCLCSLLFFQSLACSQSSSRSSYRPGLVTTSLFLVFCDKGNNPCSAMHSVTSCRVTTH